jgi:hypothetical protein
MQRTLWIGAIGLAGLAFWLFTAMNEPAGPSARSGVEQPSLVGSSTGSDRAERHAGRLAGGEAPAGSRATDPKRSSVLEAEGGPRRETTPLGSSAPARNEFDDVVPPRDESDADATASVVPTAPGSSGPISGSQTADHATARSTGRGDGPSTAETPVVPNEDEALGYYLARRSLGENPSDSELKKRQGLARTLLSAESQEVRDRVNARAAETGAAY